MCVEAERARLRLQVAQDREETFKDQTAASQAKEINYKVAQPNVAATAVRGNVAVERGAPTVGVTDQDLAAAKERCVPDDAFSVPAT